MNMYANTFYVLRNIVKTHNFIQTVLMIIYKSCFKRLILSLQYSYLWYTDTSYEFYEPYQTQNIRNQSPYIMYLHCTFFSVDLVPSRV